MTFLRLISFGALALCMLAPALAARVNAPNPNAPQEPISIDANQMEVRDKDKMAIFTGKVVAIQGKTRMETEQMKVFYEDNKTAPLPDAAPTPVTNQAGMGDRKVKRIEVNGAVKVIQEGQVASGNSGVYDLPTSQITLTGDVVLVQNGNVVHGNQLVVNTKTQESRVLSSGSNRVRALIIQGADKNDPLTPSARP